MNLEQRKQVFVALGKAIEQLDSETRHFIQARAKNNNNWFTEESIDKAIGGILDYLHPDNLDKWLTKYTIQDTPQIKKIGVVMAGNIPAVGFHDFLSVLISGHTILAKMSSEDNVLIKFIADLLIKIEPAFEERIFFPDLLKEADVFIATGSDNSARYFEYYFKNKPHIVRKNRVSVAVLNEKEAADDFMGLGEDIFTYYGLGCRNVSKMYVPEGYDFVPFYDHIEPFKSIAEHHKYNNNYDYNKAIYLIKSVPHMDNGFLLITEDNAIASPPSVVFYEYYKDQADLDKKLADNQHKIQCIVSKDAWYPQSFAFGEAQKPQLWDYADGVDTMEFLTKLDLGS